MSDPVFDLYFTTGDATEDMTGRVVDENGCTVHAVGSGTQFGNAEPITDTLTSLLRFGDIRVGVGMGNRLPTVALAIEGPSLAAITATENRLHASVGQPGLLHWQPDDVTAEVCVFEVTWSDLQPQFDAREGRLLRRTLTWEFDALPFARSTELSTMTLSTGSPAVVDDGTSAAPWSTFGGATFTVESGKLKVTGHTVGDALIRTGSVALETGDYLILRTNGLPFQSIATSAGGTFGPTLPFAALIGTDADGYGTLAYGPSPRTFTASALWFHVWSWWRSAFYIDSIATGAGVTAGRQAILELTAGGSAPTYGTIHISASEALGDVLLHSGPRTAGYAPPLSSYLHPSITAPSQLDTSSPTGRVWSLFGGIDTHLWSADMPASLFQSQGSAVLWAYAWVGDHTKPVTFNYFIETWRNGAAVPGGTSGSLRHTFAASAQLELIPLAVVPTPPTPVGPAGSVGVSIGQAAGDDQAIMLGEAFLTTIGPDCATTVIRAGSHTDLWIKAPAVDDPGGSIWVGDGGDIDGAYHGGPLVQYGADEPHIFLPDGTRSFLLTAASSAAMDVEWYARFRDHVSS